MIKEYICMYNCSQGSLNEMRWNYDILCMYFFAMQNNFTGIELQLRRIVAELHRRAKDFTNSDF